MSVYSAEQFIAHRGLQCRYPENSLRGLQAAIDVGAKQVELDVQFCRDGVPLLYHDHELRRISGRDGCVTDYPLEQLRQMPANEPDRFQGRFDDVRIEPLAALLPMMRTNPDVTFYIELKPKAIAQNGVAHCLRSLRALLLPVMGNCVLISFDEQAVMLAKQVYGFLQTGIVLTEWENRNAVIAATSADIAYINVNKIPEPDSIKADCPIAIYEIADTQQALALLQRGADKIESFAIDKLLRALCPTLG